MVSRLSGRSKAEADGGSRCTRTLITNIVPRRCKYQARRRLAETADRQSCSLEESLVATQASSARSTSPKADRYVFSNDCRRFNPDTWHEASLAHAIDAISLVRLMRGATVYVCMELLPLCAAFAGLAQRLRMTHEVRRPRPVHQRRSASGRRSRLCCLIGAATTL
jgi:hypothetical protein